MSAVPKRREESPLRKRKTPGSSVIPFPRDTGPGKPGEKAPPSPRRGEAHRPPPPRGIPILRLERPISIAGIVASLVAWSLVANGTLLARVEARDSRAALQRIQGDISQVSLQIERAKASLEAKDAVEAAGTLPIDPNGVVRLTLPPAL
jgi:hypothetical protein